MTSETESNLAKEALILDLFDGYLSAKPSAENLARYLAAVADLSVEAVARSVKQFNDGLVERDNRDFAPSAETFSHNARRWQKAIDTRDDTGPKLYNGLLNMDFGRGLVDMRGLKREEQDRIIDLNGVAPDGRSFSGMAIESIKTALEQGEMAQVEAGKSFKIPSLGRMS